MKNQKGITLIALVITIIVLLILAGVAIAMLSGENGILNKASESAKETSVNSAKEQIALVVNEAITDYYDLVYVDGNLNTSTAGAQVAVVSALRDTSKLKFDDTITYTAPAAITESSETASTFTIVFDGDNTTYTGSISEKGKVSWDK